MVRAQGKRQQRVLGLYSSFLTRNKLLSQGIFVISSGVFYFIFGDTCV
jgi:hypothetical protein